MAKTAFNSACAFAPMRITALSFGNAKATSVNFAALHLRSLLFAFSHISLTSTKVRAYTLVGFAPDRDFAFIELNRALRSIHAEHCETLLRELREIGAFVRQDPITDLYIVNEEFSLSLVVVRCQATASGSMRWNLRFDASLRPDVTIAVRLDPDNRTVRDYYLFPGTDLFTTRLRLGSENGILIDLFRFDDLRFLIGMAERRSIETAA